ncbi:zinc ribbon domain-containing protein [Planomonospora sp. ID67723]|uniref:zinc ribbon domain-containing protein n=1 Tax=Planomonospora sp. ID67723 TaxID=2738134 RepID=UPI0018C3AF8B|nr:zinc ribbon domain-containing protein [Planomonospora sp. ID67723]MBG0829233.1 zinc ribbon domain-containing protein [Planomonospora sp. ID67723]
MRRLGTVFALLGGVVLAVAAMPAALAHEHPSGITDLVTPAIVRVEAKAKVDITLLDHIGKLQHIERSYEVPLGSGTGTVVNPEGAIVTLTRVVQTDKDVAVHAANKIFAEHHNVEIPDDFERHTIKDDTLNRHLQECYPPKKPTATCIIDVATEIQIFPNITPADEQGFKAEIVRPGSRPDGPVVLMPVGRADGSAGLPTAPLAAKVPDKEGAPVAVAGFTGRPSASLKEKVDIAHLRAGGAGDGGRQFKDPEGKVDEPPKVGKLIDQGLLGGPVIEDKEGKVVGLLVGGGQDGRMIGVREITKALAEAGVTARRGPIDAAFEQALIRFHTKYYGDAVPGFQRVLDLYPGHPVAAALLKDSQAKRGTAEDEGSRRAAAGSPDRTSGLPLWPFLVGGGVLVVAVVAGALLYWRRGAQAGPGADGSGGTGERGFGTGERGFGAESGGITAGSTGPRGAGAPAPGPPPAGPRPPLDEDAGATVVVGRSFPALPVVSSPAEPGRPSASGQPPAPEADTGRPPGRRVASGPPSATGQAPATGQPVLVARDPGPRADATAGGTAVNQKYCTACGMRLGPAHRFCGYCGHPAEA